jgi:hypothetical protein
MVFSPISASIGGIAWAANHRMPPHNPLVFLILDKKSSFLNWERRQVPIFRKTIDGWALFNRVRLGDQSIIGDQINRVELSGIDLFVKNAIKNLK